MINLLMRLKRKTFYIFILNCFITNTVFSKNVQQNQYNYSNTLGSPITTLNTDTGDKGDFSLTQRTQYYRNYRLPDSLLLESPYSENQLGYLLNYVGMAYSFTKNLNIGMAIPWLNATNITSAIPNGNPPSLAIINQGNVQGISDTSIYGLWRFMNDDVKPNPIKLSSALTFGLTLPTGKKNLRTNTSDLFYVTDQPGTGAVSAILGVVFSKEFGDLSVSNDYVYTYSTQGSQGITIGSYFQYDLAMVYPFIQTVTKKNTSLTFNAVLEMNGIYTAKDMLQGEPVIDTGGNQIFLSPGLRVDMGESLSLYCASSIPIAQRYFGTQSDNQFILYSGGSLIF